MSPKLRSLYICSNCGYQSTKWIGKCPNCSEWNTFLEEVVERKVTKKSAEKPLPEFKRLEEIKTERTKRITSRLPEFDRLMGGGVVPGSVILLSGEPGIGKSTLLLQIAHLFAEQEKVLYISGEESGEQIKLRADRLKLRSSNLFILTETDLSLVEGTIRKLKPAVTIIDSIQTISNSEINSLTGSITQIKECADTLLHLAKEENTILFLIGHITKEGAIAGPKILEHMVDVVLYLEGDRNLGFRLLRSHKNRYGSTFELAVFEMTSDGLKEVNNPSSYFIEKTDKALPGSVIVTVMEGTRPILIEIQALVSPTNMPYPRRVSEGVDYNKILLLAAILEKLMGIPLNNQEIYIKVVGGMKVQEPAMDLGIACAILSSFRNIPLDLNTVYIGEIGLTGEVRPVPYLEQRLNEISKLEFKRAVIPSSSRNKLPRSFAPLQVLEMKYINDLYKLFPKDKEAVHV